MGRQSHPAGHRPVGLRTSCYVQKEEEMTSADLLSDAFGRIRESVEEVLDGLTTAKLSSRADPEANSIAWLVWHLVRVQDDHVAAVAGIEQAWTSSGWAERFALPLDHRRHRLRPRPRTKWVPSRLRPRTSSDTSTPSTTTRSSS